MNTNHEPSNCPFCGGKAEMHEWQEVDAQRWAAQVKCTGCGAEGPIGYADNQLGCYDAVNDLHKARALAAWNKRTPVSLDDNEISEAHKNFLDEIDRKAEAGLCSMSHGGTRAFLKDIRSMISEALAVKS
jgi:Lar family restriction alleviation protein